MARRPQRSGGGSDRAGQTRRHLCLWRARPDPPARRVASGRRHRGHRHRGRLRARSISARVPVVATLQTWRGLSTVVACDRRERHAEPARSAARWTQNATRSTNGRQAGETTASAEHDAMVNDLHESVRNALRALPTKYREVVTCRYLLELTERETAAVLDLPAGTVKSRLSRALDQMETRLQKETSDG